MCGYMCGFTYLLSLSLILLRYFKFASFLLFVWSKALFNVVGGLLSSVGDVNGFLLRISLILSLWYCCKRSSSLPFTTLSFLPTGFTFTILSFPSLPQRGYQIESKLIRYWHDYSHILTYRLLIVYGYSCSYNYRWARDRLSKLYGENIHFCSLTAENS